MQRVSGLDRVKHPVLGKGQVQTSLLRQNPQFIRHFSLGVGAKVDGHRRVGAKYSRMAGSNCSRTKPGVRSLRPAATRPRRSSAVVALVLSDPHCSPVARFGLRHDKVPSLYVTNEHKLLTNVADGRRIFHLMGESCVKLLSLSCEKVGGSPGCQVNTTKGPVSR